MRTKKWTLAPVEAQGLHAKLTIARDMMIEVAEWTVRHYADKRTRKAVADVWRHFGATWVCIEDVLVDNGAKRPMTAVALSYSMRRLPKKMQPSPTIAKHIEMAEKIGVARASIADVFCRLAQALAQNARPVRGAEKAYKLLGALRHQLDNRLHEEHPGKRMVDVYYGGKCAHDDAPKGKPVDETAERAALEDKRR